VADLVFAVDVATAETLHSLILVPETRAPKFAPSLFEAQLRGQAVHPAPPTDCSSITAAHGGLSLGCGCGFGLDDAWVSIRYKQ